MSNFQRQIERETGSVTKGVQRFYTQLNRDAHKGREFDGPVGQSLTRDLMTQFVPEVERLRKEAMEVTAQNLLAGKPARGWHGCLLMLPAPDVAYIAIRTLLSAAPGMSRLVLAKRIGRVINLEIRWRHARRIEAARNKAKATQPLYNRIQYFMRENAVHVKSVSKWLRKLADIETQVWDHRQAAEIGLPLLFSLCDTCSDVFQRHQFQQRRYGRAHIMETVLITDKTREYLTKSYKEYAEGHPWLEPMVCPPLHWQKGEKGWEGGYLRLSDGALFKVAPQHRHTSAILDEIEVPDLVIDAVNKVQRTPWRVNAPVLAVCQRAHEAGITAVLPVEPVQPLPPKLGDEVWATLSKDERGAIRNQRRLVHETNFRLESKRDAMRRQLSVAHSLRDEPEIFFPHNMDFRGRLYPLPQDLHPQANDMGRSLIMFSSARQLGAAGLEWLGYHAANCYGLDKMTRQEQAHWVDEYKLAIKVLAADPFGKVMPFWAKAEDKWQFLAAAMELAAAWNSPNPEAYYSRLPVHVDGSCNGLQHLSAMGLDPIGAHATNLTADPQRQDIYQIVADKVSARVSSDAALHGPGHPSANWLGKVTRKTVKRGVMTVPYGLTAIGMRDQLINDGWTSEIRGDHQVNANYLRDRMRGAIEDTVSAASLIMEWMQGNAEILAKNHKAVRWVTPAGLVVQQGYTRPIEKRISTIVGVGAYRKKERTLVHAQGEVYWQNKQVSSVVPNIIHSFDAAHLMLTMAAAPAGVCVAAVHDSFGCHAGDMPVFLDTIREQFVEIYRQDWFAQLQADFEACRGTDDFPLLPPPTRADFDIEQVKNAPFFFA